MHINKEDFTGGIVIKVTFIYTMHCCPPIILLKYKHINISKRTDSTLSKRGTSNIISKPLQSNVSNRNDTAINILQISV